MHVKDATFADIDEETNVLLTSIVHNISIKEKFKKCEVILTHTCAVAHHRSYQVDH
jgi:hypothetical protein